MTTITNRAAERRLAVRQALSARYPHLLPPAPKPIDRTALVLGRDDRGGIIQMPQRARLEHGHVIGTTGGGKTYFLEHCIRQDIVDGHGVCVVDPHGNHPDSLYRSLLCWLRERGYTSSRVVHLMDPSAPTHTVGFNPLERPEEDTDLSVIAGVTLEAFSRAWGGEDTTTKPTIERVLTTTFTALADLELTLVEAPLLYDREDRHGLRAWAIKAVRDQYARDELLRLHELSLDERRRHDFDIEVIGPINRIARFIRPLAVRMMIGQSTRTIDVRRALDEGHIILANLSGGSRIYERDADLLGRLLVRALFFHAKRRRFPGRPVFVYLDECHRYLSGDLENILAEVRKYGLAVVASHQWLAQLENESEGMLAAVRNATNLKVVFRVKDPMEAEDLAHMVVPLDLEIPVRSLVKPTVVKHRLVRLKSAGTSEQASTTEMRTEGLGVSEGEAYSEVESAAHTMAEGESSAESIASSLAEGFGHSSVSGTAAGTSASTMMLPDGTILQSPTIAGMSEGQSAATHSAQGITNSAMKGRTAGTMRGKSTMRAHTTGSATGRSVSFARQYSVALGRGETRGTGRSQGEQEGFEPIMEDRASAVHGKDNVLYMAAQTLRTLTTGRAFVNFVDASGMKAALLTVPNVRTCALPTAEFEELRRRVLDESPSALPVDEARTYLEERKRALISQAQASRAAAEPDEPGEFRHKKKRPRKPKT